MNILNDIYMIDYSFVCRLNIVICSTIPLLFNIVKTFVSHSRVTQHLFKGGRKTTLICKKNVNIYLLKNIYIHTHTHTIN